MSSMRPKGVRITLGGEEREFLFTLNAIDEIQSESEMTVFETLQGLTDVHTQPSMAKLLVRCLYNDSVEYEKYKDPKSTAKTITDKEAGWLITNENLQEVVGAIIKAYGLSVPEPEEGDDDPNSQSEQQNN